MSATDELVRIKTRADNATTGPWDYDDSTIYAGDWDEGIASYDPRYGATDAQFIAAARTDVPTLVAALEAVLTVHQPLGGYHVDGGRCAGCNGRYVHPCPTVRAIEEHL